MVSTYCRIYTNITYSHVFAEIFSLCIHSHDIFIYILPKRLRHPFMDGGVFADRVVVSLVKTVCFKSCAI
jgi:hypothetical protein